MSKYILRVSDLNVSYFFDVYINIFGFGWKAFNKAFLRRYKCFSTTRFFKRVYSPSPTVVPETGGDPSHPPQYSLYLGSSAAMSLSLPPSLSPMITLTTGRQTGRSRSRSWPHHCGRTQSTAALPSLSSSLIKLPRSNAVRYVY